MQTLRSKFGFHQSRYHGKYNTFICNAVPQYMLCCFRITKLICTCVNTGQIPDWTTRSWWTHWTWTIPIWSKPFGNPKFTFPMPKTPNFSTSLYPMYWYALIQADKYYICYGKFNYFWKIKMRIFWGFFRSLKLKFSCMMELSNFPLDEQVCTMEIASCKCIFIVAHSYQEPLKLFSLLISPQFLKRRKN